MVEYKKYIIGFIVVLISLSVVYVQFQDKVKIRIDKDKSTFYVLNDNNRWEVSGREYNSIFSGTTKNYRDKSIINIETVFNNLTKETTITRNTPYKNGCYVKDTYLFDGSVNDIELFPISHNVEIFNCSGKFYRYEVRDLEYNGETEKLYGTSMEFGKNMKIEWDEGYNWAWVYKTGILKVQYKIKTNYEKFNVRLFDPPVEEDTIIQELFSLQHSTETPLYNSLISINSTHYMLAYGNSTLSGGYIKVFKYNNITNNITELYSLYHSSDNVGHNSLVKIDSTHYMLAFAGLNNDGYIKTFEYNVTDNSITELFSIEHDTGVGWFNSLVKIDDTHYMLAYYGCGGDGCIKTFEYNQTNNNVTELFSLSHDSGVGYENSLVKINDTHYMLAYEDSVPNGIMKTFVYNPSNNNVTELFSLTHDSNLNNFNSLVKIDDTHYTLAYQGLDSDGYIKTFEYNQTNNNVTELFSLEYDVNRSDLNSLVKMNSTHYMLAYYGNIDNDGYMKMFEYNPSNNNLTNIYTIKHSVIGTYNSLLNISETRSLLATYGDSSYSYMKLFVYDNLEITEINCTSIRCTDTEPYWTNDSSPSFSLTTNLLANCSINGTLCTTTDYYLHSCTSGILNEGSNVVGINCTDTSNNTYTLTDYNVFVDTINPSATFNSPSSGNISVIVPSDISINVTFSDNIIVENISCYVNGTLNITNTTPINNTAWVWTFTANNYVNYTINCTGYDNVSNSNTTELRWFNFYIKPAELNYTFGTNISGMYFYPNLSLFNYTTLTLTDYNVSVVNQTQSNPFLTVCNDGGIPGNVSMWVNETNSKYIVRCKPYYDAYTSTWCYQETANVSSGCGTYSTGGYNIGAGWNNPERLTDGSFSTFGSTVGGTNLFYINYTKPSNAQLGSLWTYKDGFAVVENTTLPVQCFNQTPLQLLINQTTPAGFALSFDCWNGTNWEQLDSSAGTSIVYEEAVWWYYGNYILSDTSNITINSSLGSLDCNNVWCWMDFINISTDFLFTWNVSIV